MGHLIPAGTGFKTHRDIEVVKVPALGGEEKPAKPTRVKKEKVKVSVKKKGKKIKAKVKVKKKK